jgi:hypothetical protein
MTYIVVAFKMLSRKEALLLLMQPSTLFDWKSFIKTPFNRLPCNLSYLAPSGLSALGVQFSSAQLCGAKGEC